MSTKKLPLAAAAFDEAVRDDWFPAAGAVAAAEVLGCSAVEAINALLAFGHVEAAIFNRPGVERDPGALWLRYPEAAG